MKALIDTNVILDVLLGREEHLHHSKNVWACCELGLMHGFLPAFSAINCMYLIRKQLTPDMLDSVLIKLSNIFILESTNPSDLLKASRDKWNDFEDCVQYNIAKRLKLDTIVTRNTKDFARSDIPVLTPAEAIRYI
jgi:predicted nucleic acid-binding protein